MNTGYRYQVIPEEAVTQSYGVSDYRINPIENRVDTTDFRMLNTAADTCSVEAPMFDSVFKMLPIVEDNFQRMMEPPAAWNVFRMNPVDYRWINHTGFMSNFRTVPTDNDQSNQESSSFAMNTNNQILRSEPECASVKYMGNFGETRFTNGYSGHADINRYETCFDTMPDVENVHESSAFRVNPSINNSFINVNALDRTAVISVNGFGIKSTAEGNAYQIRNSNILNQTPTMPVGSFDMNSSVADAQCKLDSMTELVRTSLSSTCKNGMSFSAMESNVQNCPTVGIAKSYHQIEAVVAQRDSRKFENKLTVKDNIASERKKVRTTCTGIVTDDVKKITKITKLKSKSRKKLNAGTTISNVGKAETNNFERIVEKSNRLLPVIGIAYELINSNTISATTKEDRFDLLVNDQGSFLIGTSNNNTSTQLTVNNTVSESTANNLSIDLTLNNASRQTMKLEAPTKVDRRRKRHECKVCGKVVKKSKYLVVHMITHTGEKPYTCAVCSKRFAQQQHLKRHERIHTGERPYVCVVCDKRFARDENLDRHILAHTKVKNYSCPVCSRQFGTKGAVKMHLMIHTGEQPFECNICSKRFRQQENMNRHLTTHTGAKNFSCKQCNKSFASKQLVKIHQISHSDVRPYVCTVCKKTYKASDSLRAHTRRKHWDISNKRH